MLLAGVPQILSPALPAVQHVTVATGASASALAPGASASLWVDVTPKTKIRVYGPGTKLFKPVELVLSPTVGINSAKPQYPMTELFAVPGTSEPVPVYQNAFRILQPITVSKSLKAGQTLDVQGVLKYESCDDRLCYPLLSLPVAWTLTIR